MGEMEIFAKPSLSIVLQMTQEQYEEWQKRKADPEITARIKRDAEMFERINLRSSSWGMKSKDSYGFRNPEKFLLSIPYFTTHHEGIVKPTVLAVDFDGTIAKNLWPGIGDPNIWLINFLIDFQRNGGELILWTCRTKERLDEVVAFCKTFGLVFDAVNENLPSQKELYGNDSRKIGADYYLDDKCIRIE